MMPTEIDVLRNRIEKRWPLTLRQAIEYLDLRGGEIAEENEELKRLARKRRKSGSATIRKKRKQTRVKRG